MHDPLCPHSALSPVVLGNCSLGSNQGFPVNEERGDRLPGPLLSSPNLGHDDECDMRSFQITSALIVWAHFS